MAMYALEDLDDAVDLTRSFLTPIDRRVWLKLAVVAFFIGGPGANFNTAQYSTGPGGSGGGPDFGTWPGMDANVLAVVAAIAGAILVIALGLALVGSIMEFVFVESLRSREVTVRRYWSRRWRQGVRLFGFRIVIGLFVLAIVALVALPFVLGLAGLAPIGGGASIALLIVLVPLLVVVAAVVGVVNGFTTVFVVPVMIKEECGVLAGWRRLWPSITANWEQYLGYAVAGVILSMLGGILIGILTVLLAVLLVVPFGILFAVGYGVLAVAQPVGLAMLVVVVAGFVLAVLAGAAIVQVPVQVYLRYYALLVLGDVDPDLDLIPDQRAAVRDAA